METGTGYLMTLFATKMIADHVFAEIIHRITALSALATAALEPVASHLRALPH